MELGTNIITDTEFLRFQNLIFEIAGISLSGKKHQLVASRLTKRLMHLGMKNFTEYFEFLAAGHNQEELQTAVDLLTTHETHFFREPKHFDFLREQFCGERKQEEPIRVWSAACSTGEEPYSIAMVMRDTLKAFGNWTVLGSDISRQALRKAVKAEYPLTQVGEINDDYRQRFCLRGNGAKADKFLIDSSICDRVDFRQMNLNSAIPSVEKFDLIFLRNVMIYFSQETKILVVERLLNLLKPAGYLLVGHSETLHGVTERLQAVAPAVYRLKS